MQQARDYRDRDKKNGPLMRNGPLSRISGHRDPSSLVGRNWIACALTVRAEQRERQRAQRWILHKFLGVVMDLIEPDEDSFTTQPCGREATPRVMRQEHQPAMGPA